MERPSFNPYSNGTFSKCSLFFERTNPNQRKESTAHSRYWMNRMLFYRGTSEERIFLVSERGTDLTFNVTFRQWSWTRILSFSKSKSGLHGMDKAFCYLKRTWKGQAAFQISNHRGKRGSHLSIAFCFQVAIVRMHSRKCIQGPIPN